MTSFSMNFSMKLSVAGTACCYVNGGFWIVVGIVRISGAAVNLVVVNGQYSL